MSDQQKLELGVSVVGAPQAAQQLKDVDQAVKQTATSQTAAAASTNVATDAQKRANANNEDWLRALRSIHPALGGVAETMLRSSRVAGDLAGKNIELGGAIEKVTGFVKSNASAFLLLGAGAAAYFAVRQMIGAWQAMEEQIRKAQKAVEDFRSAQTQAQQGDMEIADSVNEAADRQATELSPDARRVAASRAVGMVNRGAKPETAAEITGSLTEKTLEGLSQDELLILAQAAERGDMKTDELARMSDARQEEHVRGVLKSRRGKRAAENLESRADIQTREDAEGLGQLEGSTTPRFTSPFDANDDGQDDPLWGWDGDPAGGKVVSRTGSDAKARALIEEKLGPQKDMDETVRRLTALVTLEKEKSNVPLEDRFNQALSDNAGAVLGDNMAGIGETPPESAFGETRAMLDTLRGAVNRGTRAPVIGGDPDRQGAGAGGANEMKGAADKHASAADKLNAAADRLASAANRLGQAGRPAGHGPVQTNDARARNGYTLRDEMFA